MATAKSRKTVVKDENGAAGRFRDDSSGQQLAGTCVAHVTLLPWGPACYVCGPTVFPHVWFCSELCGLIPPPDQVQNPPNSFVIYLFMLIRR